MNKIIGKQYLLDYVKQYIQPSKNNMYQCPFCHSGAGGTAESDGAFSVNPHTNYSTWKCFSCDASGDIFDLVSGLEGISLKESFTRVANLYHLEEESPHFRERISHSKEDSKKKMSDHKETQPISTSKTYGNSSEISSTYEKKWEEIEVIPSHLDDFPLPEKKSCQTYLEECGQRLWEESGSALSYLLQRGLTETTIQRFQLGKDGGFITIPYNTQGTYYMKRNIDPSATFKHSKPKREDVGEEPMFQENILYEKGSTPVFVVESAFCAMSIFQGGGQAIALGGTGSRRLLHLLQETPCEKMLLLSLDNDEAGHRAMTQLSSKLEEIGQNHDIVNISGIYKDPNDHCQHEPDTFFSMIQETIRTMEDNTLHQYQQDYATHSFMQQLKKEIQEQAHKPLYATGFSGLDQLLDGGLHEGLYVMGAISSLGKTTFSLQVADALGKQGHDVLFFSLEMARSELMAKSISRETLESVLTHQGTMHFAKTTREILLGKQWVHYAQEEKQWIYSAMNTYESYAHHLYIFEGIGNIGVEEIQKAVHRHVEITGRLPVVMIDYLQILAPYQERNTEKQNTDKATLELKRLSRDLHLPIWVISSFNRDNYTVPVNTASFKESGAIEYSSDVLLGLQYQGMEYKKGEKESERTLRLRVDREKREEDLRKGSPVTVEVKVLKNRNGLRGTSTLSFYPRYNFYQEL